MGSNFQAIIPTRQPNKQPTKPQLASPSPRTPLRQTTPLPSLGSCEILQLPEHDPAVPGLLENAWQPLYPRSWNRLWPMWVSSCRGVPQSGRPIHTHILGGFHVQVLVGNNAQPSNDFPQPSALSCGIPSKLVSALDAIWPACALAWRRRLPLQHHLPDQGGAKVPFRSSVFTNLDTNKPKKKTHILPRGAAGAETRTACS
jgi:hypothetical protein